MVPAEKNALLMLGRGASPAQPPTSAATVQLVRKPSMASKGTNNEHSALLHNRSGRDMPALMVVDLCHLNQDIRRYEYGCL